MYTQNTASAPRVLICSLALLLVRIIETPACGSVREDLQNLHVGVHGPAGTFAQNSEPTAATKAVLTVLEIRCSPRRPSADWASTQLYWPAGRRCPGTPGAPRRLHQGLELGDVVGQRIGRRAV